VRGVFRLGEERADGHRLELRLVELFAKSEVQRARQHGHHSDGVRMPVGLQSRMGGYLDPFGVGLGGARIAEERGRLQPVLLRIAAPLQLLGKNANGRDGIGRGCPDAPQCRGRDEHCRRQRAFSLKETHGFPFVPRWIVGRPSLTRLRLIPQS